MMTGRVDTRRFDALLQVFGRAHEALARHDDAVVGRDQMLAHAVLNPAHALLERRILHADAFDAAEGHGIVTASATVEEATLAAIHLERLANANYLCAQLGSARVIPPEEIEQMASGPRVGYKVRWGYYASLIK